ncbi:MAG: Gfo/Idh/MocA family oxidoreductase [Clostridia bacterium]|nr:Gfo/Idh/MocA family oxidoreductase [Clostridia bacterium]
MKVSVIGCGAISRVHLGVIDSLSDVELISVVDTKPEKAQAAAEKHNTVAFTSFEEMLENQTPDVIHLCVPHYLHVPMALEALKRNISVLSEKPEATNNDDLNRLIEAEANSEAKFGVCFQNRYNDSVQMLKKIIESGEYGKVTGVRAFITWKREEAYFVESGWRGTRKMEGGSLLINQAIHTLDLIGYLCGDYEIVRAHAFNDHLEGVIETEDTANAFLKFKDGVRGQFFATLAYADNCPVFIEISMENKVFRLEGDVLYDINKNGEHKLLLGATEQKAGEAKDYWGTGHGKLIRDFYDCVRNNKDFAINSKEGGKAIKAVFDIYNKVKEGLKK